MSFQQPLTIIGPLALAFPLIVTLVLCIVARREGSLLPAGAIWRLSIATLAAMALALRFSTDPIAIVVATAVLFLVFAMPVMRAFERSTIDRMPADPIRTATLVPRHVGTHVPLWARSASMVAALLGLGWVVSRIMTASLPLTMAIGFTIAALTFYGLYETWMRQEISSVRAASDEDRRRRVRAIFAAQTFLTLAFLLMAGLSVGSWPGLIPLGVAGGIAGSIGCAFALSTGIQERYLQAWGARR